MSAGPLFEYHDRLLRGWSPLTVGQRELIAAFVSGLNACIYCHGAHTIAAQAFGIDEGMFASLMNDLDAAPVADKLKPILAYVRKLTLTPAKISGGFEGDDPHEAPPTYTKLLSLWDIRSDNQENSD